MDPRTDSAEARPTPTVFLPCHSLEDFPTWLDEHEADEVLAAWIAAWHPALVAAAGRRPRWASVDLPPPTGGPLVAIVPPAYDERFAVQLDGRPTSPLDRQVRGVHGREAILAAAAGPDAAGDGWRDEFHALGLAVLLAELLARRMRSSTELDAADFSDAVAAAARAAVEGRDGDVPAELATCYGFLESSRARFYPVDSWLLDLVLLAGSTLGEPLRGELAAAGPVGIVAPARLAGVLAESHPESLAAVRAAAAAGRVSLASGRLGDRPLDACTPEEIAADISAGVTAWETHLGRPPDCFAEIAGGSSAVLPQILASLGIESALWQRFDGTRLPDPGSGRIRWEGTGSGGVEACARPPLDARSARAILELPERLGDAMDHDHVVVVSFAHYAGTAGPWHGLLRRIGARSSLLGTFVTPATLFANTAGSGNLVSFEPDAFPPTRPTALPPGTRANGPSDPVAAAIHEVGTAARQLVAQTAAIAPWLVPTRPGGDSDAAGHPPEGSPDARAAGLRGSLGRGWWPRRVREQPLVLEHGLMRLEVHRRTGGILSLRCPADRGNRLSQQLSVRGTHPQGAGRWLPVEERAWYSRMEADRVAPGPTRSGLAGLVAEGRLVDGESRQLGRFTQGVALVPGRPLAILDLAVELAEAIDGDPLEHHLACRFAWHENEDMEIRRGIHTQSVPTERGWFTAPHFVEIRPADGTGQPVGILAGGVPWHLLSTPHVLDTILACAGGVAGRPIERRLAVGIGVPALSATAIEFAAGELAQPAAVGSPGRPAGTTARLTVERVDAVNADAGAVRARVGLLETAGQSGEVRIDWAADVVRATACDLRGRPRPDTPVAIVGRSTVVFLRRYEWVHLELELA